MGIYGYVCVSLGIYDCDIRTNMGGDTNFPTDLCPRDPFLTISTDTRMDFTYDGQFLVTSGEVPKVFFSG